jgi:AcrR family transcriptional regulator
MRIVSAGAELARGFASWNWQELTFRAVAERAGVGERTVYRHFPTERHLHDAVMQSLEDDAGISYDAVDLGNVTDVTARVFAALQRFSADRETPATDDPTLTGVDDRRTAALRQAVSEATPHWSQSRRDVAAGLLDVLWSVPNYERLVGRWNVPAADATAAITWLMDEVLAAIADEEPRSPFA